MQQFRGQEFESGNQSTIDISATSSKTQSVANKAEFSVSKVLLWLGLGLLITGIVSMSIPDLLVLLANRLESPENVSNAYVGIIIASVILMLPSAIIVNVQALRKNKPLIITSYLCYSVFMGVLLSAVMLELFIDQPTSFIRTIGIAFLVTAGVFVILGLIGIKVKFNHPFLAIILSCLGAGLMMMILIYFFVSSSLLYLAIEGGLLLYMLLLTVLDFNRVRRIAEGSDGLAEGTGTNLAIYCAFNLYVDFIYIFLRVLAIIASLTKNR